MPVNTKIKIVLFQNAHGKLLFRPYGWHKILLLVIGALLGGFTGAAIGFGIGCMFDTSYIEFKRPPETPDLRLNFFMLAAYVLRTSGMAGRIPEREVESRLMKQFGVPYVEKRMIFFRELLRQRIQVEAICQQIRRHAAQEDKVGLIRFLYAFILYPGLSYARLTHLLFNIGSECGVDPALLQRLATEYRPRQETYSYTYAPPEPPAFAVLGLRSSCSYAELKKAYHRLAKQYHPDSNPGLSENKQRHLQEKFRGITQAYDEIKSLRGWK